MADELASTAGGGALTRRTAISGVLSLLTAGCAIPKPRQEALNASCAGGQRDDDEPLRIDMHVHLLNQKDVNTVAFLTRRVINHDEGRRLLEPLGGVISRGAMSLLDVVTMTAEAETRDLRGLIDSGRIGSSEVCEYANGRQRGLYFSDDTVLEDGESVALGRLTGFSSNRTRNAALLMAQFPQVDIFMPLMIDFAEGDERFVTTLRENIDYHEALNLASGGRFLPLVAFNPERERRHRLLGRRAGDEPSPLDLVRDSIENRGFIGVKIHPSVGFNPIDNFDYGCPNTVLQRQESLSRAEAEGLDEAMADLFALCEELDAPIVAHGSDGLGAFDACMRAGADPSRWTNAPGHWARALEGYPRLRVCLAHFASRFHDHLKSHGRRGQYADDEFEVEYDKLGALVPSVWLQAALDAMDPAHGDDGGLWLDLSFMPELVASQLETMGRLPQLDRIRRALEKNVSDKSKYARAFSRFLEARRDKLESRVMYGTDLHMPGMHRVGGDDGYLDAIEALAKKAGYAERIMGLNAARFFRLRRGEPMRERLARFYGKRGLAHEVKWMKRVDRAAA